MAAGDASVASSPLARRSAHRSWRHLLAEQRACTVDAPASGAPRQRSQPAAARVAGAAVAALAVLSTLRPFLDEVATSIYGPSFVAPRRLLSGGRELRTSVAVYKEKGDVKIRKPTHMREGPEGWTDYTRYALGIDDRTDIQYQKGDKRDDDAVGRELLERKRSLGIDFGPEFVGMAMSLGNVNTLPLGTLQTGIDWKETCLKIAQIASTRRIQDIVIGLPLEKDGSDGKIALLVRHFAQIMADTTLLIVGSSVAVHLWDERFSTSYAAMRLVTRPRFESGAFKSWLDGQRGLDYGAKALLDAEAARAILEHWLEGDPTMGPINKEKSERVPPSRLAVRAYLNFKRFRGPLLGTRRPVEPQGPGKEAFEWDDMHPMEEDPDTFAEREENYTKFMQGTNWFGHKLMESDIRRERRAQARAAGDKNAVQNRRPPKKNQEDDSELRKHLKEALAKNMEPQQRKGLDMDSWRKSR